MLAWRVCAATPFIRFTAKALPTSDTHLSRGRRFNAEKTNLFSGIKQPSRFSCTCTSSYLEIRSSLLIYLVTYLKRCFIFSTISTLAAGNT